MKTSINLAAIAPLCALLLPVGLAAQSNAQPGLDISLSSLNELRQVATQGSERAFAESTTSCNVGTTVVNWYEAMNPDHPFIAFMITRELDGRFVQISDRSWVKHGWYSTNSSTPGCGTGICGAQGGNQIFPNCSDTYGVGNNSDAFDLGPPEEIDPWLGGWRPIGSYFDRGDPDVGFPQNNDGQRSLTDTQAQALGPFVHRIEVKSSDLGIPNARYFYMGYYVVAREPELNRENNMRSREVRITSGSATHVNGPNTNLVGTVLQHWSGARIESANNKLAGLDADGRFYIGSRVTSIGGGMWRYEYCVHNRDNRRGSTMFEIPICTGANIQNAGFRDIDDDPQNDWSFSVSNGAVRWDDTSGNNPQPWNTLFNFWFECDAAPSDGVTKLYQANPMGANPTVDITTDTPKSAPPAVSYGVGCGNPAPVLSANGLANIPSTFDLDIVNAGSFNQVAFHMSLFQANIPISGCNLLIGNSVPLASLTADASGNASLTIPLAASTTLAGFDLHFQGYVLDPVGGVLLNILNLTNGLTVPIYCN